MDRTGYQLGGIALLLAGLSSVLGSALHGPQPQTLAAFSALGASWTVSHIAIGVAGALFAVSAIALLRHFAGTPGEGWALVGSGTLLLGGVTLLGIGVWETNGFSALVAAQEGGAGVAAEHAYLAVLTVMVSMATAAGFLLPVALTAFGLGMLKEAGWPAWLSWAAVVIGLAGLVVNVFGLSLGAVSLVPQYGNNLWYAAAGVVFMGKGQATSTTT